MMSVNESFEDNLYEGYNDYHSAFNTKNIDQDVFLQEALLNSSYGRRNRVVSPVINIYDLYLIVVDINYVYFPLANWIQNSRNSNETWYI